jgi:hypothetical protein
MCDCSMRKLISRADRMYLEAYFAQVNWHAHLLPLVKNTVQEFSLELKKQNLQEPYLSVLSEDVRRGYFDHQKSEIWGDSITVSFGSRPIPARAVAPVKGRSKILSEDQASLVISQSVSGSVVALIYPPSSEVAKPLKPYYMVDFWSNPREICPMHINSLLQLMNETDMFCGAAIYPNNRGTKILAKLQAKDAILANGGSRIWVWLQYVFQATKGVLRLYGIGKPVSP